MLVEIIKRNVKLKAIDVMALAENGRL